jgi:hypothetical protein
MCVQIPQANGSVQADPVRSDAIRRDRLVDHG